MKPNQNWNLTSEFQHTETETDTLTPSSQVSTLGNYREKARLYRKKAIECGEQRKECSIEDYFKENRDVFVVFVVLCASRSCIPYGSGWQPFFNAAQIILSMDVEGPLHLKPRLQNEYATRLTTNYKMKKRCAVLNRDARSLSARGSRLDLKKVLNSSKY